MIRVVLCYTAAQQLKSWSGSSAGFFSAKCLESMVTGRDWSAYSDALEVRQLDWWWLVKSALLVYSCHAYESLKGYS